MEDFTLDLNKTIGQNIALYRKRIGLTQADLAERINYSDKSVSKWESGGGAPDIFVLTQLAQIFGVTVNDLISNEETKSVPQNTQRRLHFMIMALSSGIVWLVATFLFVILTMIPNTGKECWSAFIFALPANSIVLLVLSSVWWYKRLNFLSVTSTIWTVLLSLFILLKYVVAWDGSSWLVFLLGIPLQVLEILWAFFPHSEFVRKRKDRIASRKRSKL